MISEVVYLEYLSCLLEGDKPKCAAIVHHLLEQKVDPRELYTRLFQRSLERIGKLWENDRICGSTEHVATSITECLMSLTYPIVSSVPKNGKKAVIACVPKEFHQIGAKMIGDVFELKGWESYVLGANTPCSSLLKIIDEKKPDVLGLSLGTYLNILRLLDVLDKVTAEHPDLDIVVGGNAFRHESPEILSKYSKVSYISSFEELEEYIKEKSVVY